MNDQPVQEASGVDISIVAPCYNEAAGLSEFHRRVTSVALQTKTTYELVLVNDGSSDQTLDIMRQISTTDPMVVVVDLSRNHGHQLALTAGLAVCRGERILILDADLQDPPELLPQMLNMLDDGVDVVYGQRIARAGEGIFKKVSASAFYWILQLLTDVRIPRDTGDFRLMSRRALTVFLHMPERHRFVRGMIAWVGFRQEPILYNRDPRHAGESKYPLRKMIRFATDAITAFSIKPLKLSSTLGIAFGVVGFLLLIYTTASWAFLDAVHGWASVMAAVAILGGAQLFVLGIIGEYLGRLYEQSKGRPLFIIRSLIVNGRHRMPDQPDWIPQVSRPRYIYYERQG